MKYRHLTYIFMSTLLAAGLSIQASATPQSITSPLGYHQSTGLYTIDLTVGQLKITIPAVVDTGSSNLNLIGSPSICKNCRVLPNIQRYSPSKTSKKQSIFYYTERYGSGEGRLRIYKDHIGILGHQQIPYTFSVFESGHGIYNILGMAYSWIAEPMIFPLPTFKQATMTSGRYPNKMNFMLTLCNHMGTSSFTLGQLPKGLSLADFDITPVIHKSYYLIMLKTITSKNLKVTLANYTPQHTDDDQANMAAIVDSGTGGSILLPDTDIDRIIEYIRHYAKKHQAKTIPLAFWNKNMCTPAKNIKLSRYPTLSFNLAKWGDMAHSISVQVEPSSYLTPSLCPKGMLRFAFIKEKNTVANRVNLRKFKQFLAQPKVLGTPFLENHHVYFIPGNNFNLSSRYSARIGFSKNQPVCK